jgi:2-polyprenyl-6-methoxyphenol hydroxylase-like FAD-dependent oxidoreductase
MMAAAQHPSPPLVIFSGKKTVRLDLASFHHEPYPYQLIIWQQGIERALLDALQKRGYSVERSTRLVRFDMDDAGVTAQVEVGSGHHNTIRATWIIGCDGGHSTVREMLGLKMEGKTLPQRYRIGEFDIDWNRSRDAMYQWWHKSGIASAIYIDFTKKWHVFVECHEPETEPPNLERMRELFRERTGDNALLRNPAWMSNLTFSQRMPERFIVDRAILAGDAAHVHTAAGGQGMNTGMQDALNLGWKLALTISGAASPALLQTYESERLPNARSVLRATLRYQRIQVPHGNIERLVAGAVFKAVVKIRPLGNALAKVTGMLDGQLQLQLAVTPKVQTRNARNLCGVAYS